MKDIVPLRMSKDVLHNKSTGFKNLSGDDRINTFNMAILLYLRLQGDMFDTFTIHTVYDNIRVSTYKYLFKATFSVCCMTFLNFSY